jgi:hypothetical protein
MTELINEKDNRLTILEQKILAKESHPNITTNEIQSPEIITNEINRVKIIKIKSWVKWVKMGKMGKKRK